MNIELKEWIETYLDGVLTVDGMDEAIIGVCERADGDTIVAYSRKKVIDIMMTRDGMSRADAEEFYYYNIVGAYMGEKTPVFIGLWDGDTCYDD